MDAIATTMIAGRLGYHHLWRRKLVSNHSSPYASLLIICVESAILSTIAKVLHLTIEDLTINPVVIPICVSVYVPIVHGTPLTGTDTHYLDACLQSYRAS
jgi:hypothetical protein